METNHPHLKYKIVEYLKCTCEELRNKIEIFSKYIFHDNEASLKARLTIELVKRVMLTQLEEN